MWRPWVSSSPDAGGQLGTHQASPGEAGCSWVGSSSCPQGLKEKWDPALIWFIGWVETIKLNSWAWGSHSASKAGTWTMLSDLICQWEIIHSPRPVLWAQLCARLGARTASWERENLCLWGTADIKGSSLMWFIQTREYIQPWGRTSCHWWQHGST